MLLLILITAFLPFINCYGPPRDNQYSQPVRISGFEYVRAVNAVATFDCDRDFGYFGSVNHSTGGDRLQLEACGNITFSQLDFPDHRPVFVDITLDNLAIGNYLITIHYTGDTGDECRRAPGRRWHLLEEFNVTRDDTGRKGFYWTAFWDHHITIKETIPGILGRAISISRRENNGDYSDVYGCVVIGLAGDLRYNGNEQTSKLIVRDLVPHNLRYG